MNQNEKAVQATAQLKLNAKLNENGGALTPEDIRAVVLRTVVFLEADDVDVEAIVGHLETVFQTIIGQPRILQDGDTAYEPWLPKRKTEIDWRFWDRYHQYLLTEKAWPPSTLDRLDFTTDQVLNLLTNPHRKGAWDRRGMVVGHVQSGKTANYVGLISKAADAGYKVIVVLAGFHKSLRSQTQIRLEEGFLGYDRSAAHPSHPGVAKRIGVGLINPAPRVDSITTRADDGDFKQSVAKNFAINPGGHPLLFVIKKNGSVLRNLLNWVRFAANARDENGREYVRDVPLLVIDDEADQGSIDTRQQALNADGTLDPDHDPTVLNRSIRELLNTFEQSAYIGYTATPFANIYIHEQGATEREGEDLFPRSFIISLPTPSNYVGPAQVFGYTGEDGESVAGLPIVRRIGDAAGSDDPAERSGWMPPRHRIGHEPRYGGQDRVPPSLRIALETFVLTCAARIARGQEREHNSMLVHVTRFNAVQSRVAEQVQSELTHLQRTLRYGDGDAEEPLLGRLRRLWEEDFVPTTHSIAERDPSYLRFSTEWATIEPHLDAAAASIQVRQINGHAGEVLDYIQHEGQGLNVVAIGGDKLSRGLTLEGLNVSYFLRASRMYDTLMQMGRWFGYRPGYLDLCRLFTTSDLTEWYAHIADASEELRQDFDRMAASGGTPRDFGHRVLSHPALLVTSQVKMRSGTAIDVTFGGDIVETINFWRDRPRLQRNWNAGLRLLDQLEKGDAKRDLDAYRQRGQILFRGATEDPILEFLSGYTEHEASRKVKSRLLSDYIRMEAAQGRLTDWTVLVAPGESARLEPIGSVDLRLPTRSWFLTSSAGQGDPLDERSALQEQNHFRIRRLVNPTDEDVDLTDSEQRSALEKTRSAWADGGRVTNVPKRPSGPSIRAERSPGRGLLILYPLDGRDAALADETAEATVVRTGKVEVDARDIPVLGFAISFPAVPDGISSKVRYVVNNVYFQQEFGTPGASTEDSSE